MEKNSMKIEIKSLLENVAVVRVAISSFVSSLNVTIDELMDIKTAVSEAVTNSIEHGYVGKNSMEDSFVVVKADISKDELDNNVVVVKIEDKGIGIDDIELAMTPAYTSKPELEHAGMGFTIMETFMDEIIIDSKKDNGTTILLTKKIKKKKSNS
ncbi:MAG: anti-sigma F factor [Clostridia bacterium]